MSSYGGFGAFGATQGPDLAALSQVQLEKLRAQGKAEELQRQKEAAAAQEKPARLLTIKRPRRKLLLSLLLPFPRLAHPLLQRRRQLPLSRLLKLSLCRLPQSKKRKC